MRISRQMDISRAPIDATGRHIEQIDRTCELDMPVGARDDFVISRTLHQRRQPADLEFRSAFDQDIRPIENWNKTRSRRHEMRILSAASQGPYLHPFAANSFSNRSVIRRRSDDVQTAVSRIRSSQSSKDERQNKNFSKISHVFLLKLMSSVRSDRKLELEPNRMIVRMPIAIVVIVLQADFRKFRWEPSQIGRKPPPIWKRESFTRTVYRLVHISAHPVVAKSGCPAATKSIHDLTIKSVVFKSLRRISHFETPQHHFALPSHEWKTVFLLQRAPMPIKIGTVNLGSSRRSALWRSIWPKGSGNSSENRLRIRYIKRRRVSGRVK